ncbi:SagB/ThcOx family dehydrogenase [Salipiger abyssi]|uniref:SagB/ThcOx family dehydrogenase n=1 Tax=Salipiger abyssi TaxID=1250539 RepID=UPI001A8D039E|nr:SagB/ThcOx family dehydrogenase [Salipiger abyssi]MBN9887996.1 SagB/ThcOx family dehydrogenase [Salipiger abyssi]
MTAEPNSDISNLLAQRRSVREFSDTPLPRAAVDRLIAAAQGYRDPSGKRAAPSAHALYPIRLFLTVARVTGMAAGVYEVDAETGEAALRTARDLRRDLREAAFEDQPWLENAPLVVTLCADLEKLNAAFFDQPPIGHRGERYAYVESGAIAQNLSLQAVEMGLGSVLVAGFDDDKTADLLQVPMRPLLHMCFGGKRRS